MAIQYQYCYEWGDDMVVIKSSAWGFLPELVNPQYGRPTIVRAHDRDSVEVSKPIDIAPGPLFPAKRHFDPANRVSTILLPPA